MAEEWNSYVCTVNGKIASIFLDLSLRKEAPIASKPWLLWIWITLLRPRNDGLSDRVELESLTNIDECLCKAMHRNCKAVLAGTITTEGRREFYFYGETHDRFEIAVREGLADVDDEHRFESGVQEDPTWRQYLNVLYPSDNDLKRMSIRDVQ